MKEEPSSRPIDPELEVRIVAMVLGEASDFERDELNRLIAERPELAAFESEIRRVHGLLRNVGEGESARDDITWKLSDEKRSKVLAAIDGNLDEQPEAKVDLTSNERKRSERRALVRNLSSIAAVLLVAVIIAGLLVPAVNSARESVRQVASVAEPNATSDPSEQLDMGAEMFMSDGAMSEEEMEFAESDFSNENDTKSALSKIRESLETSTALPSPYYLQDDVQYFPAQPESELSSRATATFESGARRRSGTASGEEQAFGALQRPDDGLAFPEAGASTASIASVDTVAPGLRDSSVVAGNEDSSPMLSRSGEEVMPGFAIPAENFSGSARNLGGFEFGEGQEVGQAQPEEPSLLGGTQLRYSVDAAERSEASGSELDVNGGLKLSDMNEGGDVGGATREMFGDMAMSDDMAMSEDEAIVPGQGLQEQYGRPGVGGGMGVGGMGGGGMGGGGGRDADGSPPESEPQASNGLSVGRVSDFDVAKGGEIGGDAESALERDQLSANAELDFQKFRAQTSKEDADRDVTRGLGVSPEEELLDGVWFGRFPKPVAGAQIGQPAVPPISGKLPKDQPGWYRSMGPAGIVTEGRAGESLPSNYHDGVATYREQLDSRQKAIRGEVSQRDALAPNESDGGFFYVPRSSASDEKFKSKTRAPIIIEKAAAPAGLDEKSAAEEAFSTFSLHVSDVSFKLAQAALASGSWPDAAKVRIEEFVNAFDYGDPMPRQSEKVACRVEQSVHPFLQQRNLLRVSMRTAAAGRASTTPLRLTLLVDNSGSMERIDRRQTLRRAFALLAQQLTPIDQVTLISFARQPRLLADKVSGDQSRQLVEFVDNLPSEGGTNIEAALKLAFEKAMEHRVDGAQNRIILLTDGAVNLGDADPESLSQMITTMRSAGIAFDAAGISAEGLNDEILEALTRKGDGRYYLLDSLEAADDGFARQVAGSLRPSAKNVKVQVEFNPKRVGRYKLLGYEKHRLNKEDFRNDKVDAAEMAAAEAGVAVYQFEAKPNGEGDVGSVSVRFRDLVTGQMVEHCWPIPYQRDPPRLDEAAPSLRIAASAALFAAKLRGEPLGETVDLKTLARLIASLPESERGQNRVGQLLQMISQARQLSGQ